MTEYINSSKIKAEILKNNKDVLRIGLTDLVYKQLSVHELCKHKFLEDTIYRNLETSLLLTMKVRIEEELERRERLDSKYIQV